jgi:hypothetical protein
LKTQTDRQGISIIEVLISMAVATIGVFGVMALIPFAINQSQKGLDNDLANAFGRNAVETLQIQGVFQTSSIANNDNSASDEVISSIVFPSAILNDECETAFLGAQKVVGNYSIESLGLSFPGDPRNGAGLVHLDPVGVAYRNGPITSFTVDSDQDNPQIIIPSVTLRNGDLNGRISGINSRYSFAEAMSLCSTGDDLIVGDRRTASASETTKTHDVAPPQQYYDMANGRRVKRQASRKISWSMMLNPSKHSSAIKEASGATASPPSHFKTWVLTYSGRSFDIAAFQTRIINPPGKYGLGVPPNRLPALTRLALADPIDDDSAIAKDSWIMLINLLPVPDYRSFNNPQLPLSNLFDATRYRADEEGYDKQVRFARVTKIDRVANPNEVVIDGSAFEIFPSGVARSGGTYMVYLPEVINVYERTVKIER